MFGSISYTVTQADGSPFQVLWDTVVPQTLYIKFTVTSLDGINPPNIAAIRAALPISYAPGVNGQVNINDLATLVHAVDPNALVTGAGFSLTSGGTYTNTLTPTAKNNQFAISSVNLIITPMILSPVTVTVTHGLTNQFTALGGFGTLTYSMSSNPSGGSINSSGLYTAGATPATDVALVTDSQGNTATATITVV
jgi:hypothetical protein